MDIVSKAIFHILLLAITAIYAQTLPPQKETEQPAQYAFEYHVNNPETGDIKSQNEIRDGNVVHGQYGLVEPNGNVRTVEYTADDQNGFQAVVHNSGGPVNANVLPKALQPTGLGAFPVDAATALSNSPAAAVSSESESTLQQVEAATAASTNAANDAAKSNEAAKTSSNSASKIPSSAYNVAALPNPFLLKNPYLDPNYKYPHPWTLNNLYKTHPAYRYGFLPSAHPLSALHPAAYPTTPLSLLNPATSLSPYAYNALHPAHPAYPTNPLSPYSYSPLHPLYNPLYHL